MSDDSIQSFVSVGGNKFNRVRYGEEQDDWGANTLSVVRFAAVRWFTANANLMTNSSRRSAPKSNHSMKPTAQFREKLSVFATTPCRSLSLSR